MTGWPRLAPGRTAMTTLTRLILSACALLITAPQHHSAAAQQLPYVPTTILLPTLTGGSSSPHPQLVGDGAVYIFHQTGSSVELKTLNISSTIDGTADLHTLSATLPFLDGVSVTTTFVPTLADDGELLVFAGDCASASDLAVWSYAPANASTGSDGSWSRLRALPPTSARVGPEFLATAFAFSATLAPTMSPPSIYTYGGMCPTSGSSIATWQSSGNYSNTMLRLSPQAAENPQYVVSSVSTSGPPVAAAGFTFTALTPSITNRSGIVTQQNNYVLLGGHTPNAFIDMSTAALWSLPEENWTFLSIEPPAAGTTELAIKAAAARRRKRAGAPLPTIDSRSGHSTVLTEDGKALVILGGWVGDVSQAAEPQLVVLEMGDTYKSWRWLVPKQQPAGTGMFGHGAVLLPGNVMMVYGGYSISPSTKTKRQALNGSPHFLNLTSMEWSDSYTNPGNLMASPEAPTAGSGTSDDNRLKIGLGVGISVAVIIIIALLLFLWYRKYVKPDRQNREIREKNIRDMSQDESRFLHHNEMIERDDGPELPWKFHAWYTGGADPYDQGVRSLGYESIRGRGRGYGGSPGQMMHVPRKPSARVARGMYQTPPGGRPSMGPTEREIHPIYEADEEVELEPRASRAGRSGEPSSAEPQTPNSHAPSDPFLTPVASSAIQPPPSPDRESSNPSPENLRRDPEVQDWYEDVDAADALLARLPPRTGRNSPTRRGSIRSARTGITDDDSRTGSNLSESSRSALSIARSGSTRSHLRVGPFSSSGGGTTLLGGASVALASAASSDGRAGSSSSSSKETFRTAKSNFAALQAEGPGLLHGRGSGGNSPKRRSRAFDDEEDEQEDDNEPGSPSKSKPRRSFFGSLRRVFSGSISGSASSSRGDSPALSDRGSPGFRYSLDRGSGDFEARSLGLGAIGGGSLLRRKQGRHAWEEVDGGARASTVTGDDGEGARPKSAEDEWDIERAVEQRLVQVVFTVPKERLRVVNAEIEREEEAILVDPSTDEHGSIRGESVGDDHVYEEASLSQEQQRLHQDEEEEDQGRQQAHPPTARDLLRAAQNAVKGKEKAALELDDSEDDEDDRRPSRRGYASMRQVKYEPSDDDGQYGSSQFNEVVAADLDAGRGSRAGDEVHTAEMVTLERPRTRVLDMVETIEKRSRSQSPATFQGGQSPEASRSHNQEGTPTRGR